MTDPRTLGRRLWWALAVIAVGAGLNNLVTVPATGADVLGSAQLTAGIIALAVLAGTRRPRGGSRE